MSPDKVSSTYVSLIKIPKEANPGKAIENRFAPPIDLQRVIPLAREGDQAAASSLYAFTVGVVRSAVQKKAGRSENVITDELAESALEKLFTDVLLQYDPELPVPPHIPKDEIPEYIRVRYKKYVRLLAGNRVIDHYRAIAKEERTYINVPRYDNQDNTLAALTLLQDGEVLTPRQMQIANLRAQGKTNPEIGSEIGLKTTSVRDTVVIARAKIEDTLLIPNGMVKLRNIKEKNDNWSTACEDGRMQAVLVLGTWYVRPEWVTEFIKNYIEPPFPEYVPVVSLGKTKTEKIFLKNNISRPELDAVNRNGKWYAHPDNIRRFLEATPTKARTSSIQIYPTPQED